MILKNSSLSWDSEWGHMQSCRPGFLCRQCHVCTLSLVDTRATRCLADYWCVWWAEWCFDMLWVFGLFSVFIQCSRVLWYVQEAVWSLVGQPWTFCHIWASTKCVWQEMNCWGLPATLLSTLVSFLAALCSYLDILPPVLMPASTSCRVCGVETYLWSQFFGKLGRWKPCCLLNLATQLIRED